MSSQLLHRPEELESNQNRFSEGGLRPPPGLGFWGRAWWWFHFLILLKLARLRFLAILAAVGATLLYWDMLTAYYERWTRSSVSFRHVCKT
jgi:hypothetical protein